MRINRIRKRDKAVVQTKKLIRHQIRQVAGTTSTGASPILYNANGDSGGLTGDENVRTKVYCYNVTGTSPAYVTRATVKPMGSLYGHDDEANDEIQIRNAFLSDPMNILGM